MLPLDDVLVEAVQPELHGAAGAADRGLETLIGRNRVVGGNAAVAPAANSQPIRISNALPNRFVNRTKQIHDFEVAPVGVDGLLIRIATTRAASVVDRQHDIAVRRQQLAIEAERVLVLSIRSTVDDEQRWISLSWLESRRLDDQAVHLGAVLALRREVFGRRELQLANDLLVVFGQLAKRAVLPARESPPARQAWSSTQQSVRPCQG